MKKVGLRTFRKKVGLFVLNVVQAMLKRGEASGREVTTRAAECIYIVDSLHLNG